MSDKVLVDALPYIDQGYDEPGVRDAAVAMVDDECRRYRPTKNYLEYLPALNMTAFETPLMLAEFERISNRVPMEPLSMKRYELPPPPPGKTTDEPAWQESVANSKAQLEHQSIRALNLELMTEYGCESWKAHLGIFTALQAKAQRQQQELKKDIQEANWQRKAKQTLTGEKLRSLEAQWVGLVSKNYEIEQACAKLEEIGFAYGEQLRQLEQDQAASAAAADEEQQRRTKQDAKEKTTESMEDNTAEEAEPEQSNVDDEDACTETKPNEETNQQNEECTSPPAEAAKVDVANAASSQPMVTDEDVEMEDVQNKEHVSENT